MTATPEQLDEARRFVDRHIRRGAVLAPVTSPLAQVAARMLEALFEAGTAIACEHRSTQAQRDAGATIVPTYGEHVMWLLCPACVAGDDPLPGHCQVCERRPSPGLRTIVVRHRSYPMVLVARLCRDCRPGRVA